MFCQNCGKQIEEGSRFCPYCGAKNIPDTEQKGQPVPTPKKKKERGKKKTPVIIIAIAALLILGLIIFAGGSSSPSEEQLILLVQDGYLGNYDTVTIKEVLGYVDGEADWRAGEPASGKYYIVECKGDVFTIQFSVSGLDDELFKVSGVEAAGVKAQGAKEHDVKAYLDSLYQLYANAHPEKGLYIDMSLSNDTLQGHIGPVRAADPVNTMPSTGENRKDLSSYAGYTEDELIGELGYEKNEYGIYPEETHMNFSFTDGKMYIIKIGKPEDIGMTLYGVGLQDSLEEAGAVLESRGFVYEGSYETADASVTSYIESETGYPYYIYTDANHNITSLAYALEKEESIYEDGQLEEESGDPVAGPLIYGTYSFENETGTVGTAEIGFYTDEDGGDYIRIECWRNDRESAYFEGMLEEDGEGYYAYDGGIDTGILVAFADGGLYVHILDSGFADIGSMEGFYSLVSALDLNEVG